MKGSHYTISSPAVQEILAGVYKNANRNYFRYTADGKTEVFAVRTRLMALGMGSTSASKILDDANIPAGSFIINKSTGGTRTVRADVETYPTQSTELLSVGEAVGVALEVDENSPDSGDATGPDNVIELDEPDEDEEPDVPQEEDLATNTSSKKSKKLTVEERDEKAARLEEVANSKRYQYIETSSGKHGIWDDRDGYVVSSHTLRRKLPRRWSG
jgi:hypothetical protein